MDATDNRFYREAVSADQLTLDLAPLTEPEVHHEATIPERFAAFDAANPHIFRALCQLIEDHQRAGLTYISIRDMFGELRLRGARTTGQPYALNNDFTAMYGLAIKSLRPDLAPMLRLRTRRAA